MGHSISWSEIGIRLLVAALAGVALGATSSARRRIGGIRTHALVTLGAALFCATASWITSDRGEILRVVAGVATGVGFVGGAVVIKHHGVVVGVATAASIWIGGALGCEIALGSPLLGLVLAVAVAVINAALLMVQRRLLRRPQRSVPQPPPRGGRDDR